MTDNPASVKLTTPTAYTDREIRRTSAISSKCSSVQRYQCRSCVSDWDCYIYIPQWVWMLGVRENWRCCERAAQMRGLRTCAIGGKIRDIVLEDPLVTDVHLALPSAAVLASIRSALKKGCCEVLEERALLPCPLTVRVQRAVLCDNLQHSPIVTPGPVSHRTRVMRQLCLSMLHHCWCLAHSLSTGCEGSD